MALRPRAERSRDGPTRPAGVGILAYGSLLEDPGTELAPLIVRRISGAETPFMIEFHRSSPLRGGAPTVVPVASGGATVRGTVLVLHESVSIEDARDLLWRRETRREDTGQRYQKPTGTDPNQMLAVELRDFAGVATVLYAQFGATLINPTPDELAALAIRSVATAAGKRGRDGITYLISLKRQGIVTPLMPLYEQAVLRRAGAANLEVALEAVRIKTTR